MLLNLKKGFAYIRKGILLWRAGRLRDAEEATLKGLSLIADFTDDEVKLEQTRGAINLGNIRRDQQRFDEAITIFEETRAECQSVGDVQGLADCQNNLGLCYYFYQASPILESERLLQAKELFADAENLYRDIEFDQGIGSALINQGMANNSLGERETAQRLFSEARIYAERAGDLFNIALAWYNEGLTLSEIGDKQAALKMMRNATMTFLRQGSPHYIGTALAEMGMILFQLQSDPRNIIHYFAVADRCFVEINLPALKDQHNDYKDALSALEMLVGHKTYMEFWSEGYKREIANMIS